MTSLMVMKQENRTMTFKPYTRLSILVVLLALGGFGGRNLYFKFKSQEQTKISKTQNESAERPVAQVHRLEQIELFDVFVAPGIVRTDGLTQVSTFSEGLVSNCKVKLGQHVVKGQPLCTIENDNPGNTYQPYPVEAPVSGRIGEIQVSVGARVNKGDKIATIVRSSQLKVELDVYVDDARRLHTGQEGQWTVAGVSESDSKTEKSVTLKITGIAPMPNMTTRTVRIELTPVKGEPGIPGSLGSVRFLFNSRLGFEVAEDVVQYRGTNAFLRTVSNSKVTWQQVKLGRIQKGKAEILNGIQNGDVVVIESNKFLNDGDEVIVKTNDLAKKGK
jgi:multidrug efflux pump subunit AcrA (membrane-fusion protein)